MYQIRRLIVSASRRLRVNFAHKFDLTVEFNNCRVHLHDILRSMKKSIDLPALVLLSECASTLHNETDYCMRL